MLRMAIVLAVMGLAWSSILTEAMGREIEVTITTKPESDAKSPFKGNRPAVDVAILLDTSNSMDGLIKQAKSQLWSIVQQFAEAKKNGQTPILRVALFEYGNTSLPASEGYIRQVVQLTDDLDAISEALFALRTNGGDEYCGQVIKEAVKRLDWSGEPNSYKAIFIAGNEPFTQGSVKYRKACKKAIEQGIIVNTIHCGSYAAGVSGQWQDAAKIAEGKYLNIDQDRAIAHIKCPQDKIIIRLNEELNKTYLWFGSSAARSRYKTNQLAQDENAAELSAPALVGRVVTKAGKAYRNTSRDLVDAFADNKSIVVEVADDELPEEVRKLSKEDRIAHVEAMLAKRKQLQEQIAKLNRERQAFIQQSASAVAQAGEATLGEAVVEAIQSQLQDSGFEVEK